MFLVSTVPANQPTDVAPQRAYDTAGFIQKLQRFGKSGRGGELHVVAPNFDIRQLAQGLEQSSEDPTTSNGIQTVTPYSEEQPTYKEKLAALSMASGIILPDYSKPPVTLEQLFFSKNRSRRHVKSGNINNRQQSRLATDPSLPNSSAYFENLCFYPMPTFSPNSSGIVPEMVARNPFELFSDRGLTKAIREYRRMRNSSDFPPPPILVSHMEVLYHEAVKNYSRCHLSHDPQLVNSIKLAFTTRWEARCSRIVGCGETGRFKTVKPIPDGKSYRI